MNFINKKQCRLQLQKIMEELNQHDDLVVATDLDTPIGYNENETENVYVVLEKLPGMNDGDTLCMVADDEGNVFYMITDVDNGEETDFHTYEEVISEYGECDCHAEDCGICKKTNAEYYMYQMAERVTAKMTAEDKKIYMDKIPQILLELKELEQKLKNN